MAQRPTQIGPYSVLGILGEGGMGSVYLSRDPESGSEVALKVLSAGRQASTAQRKRFEREVRALAQLRHPNLIELLGSGEEGGVPWLAMRRVRGQDLAEFLRTRGRLPPREAAELGIQIGSALAAAHVVGILHRDLKPENVLRTPEGRYVLTDFGLTKELERDESLRLSQTGVLQGTPGYWAPEQAKGSQDGWSFATDVYGLGALLYGALTGLPPIQGESLLEIVISTRERAPEPPSRFVPEISPALERVVLKCLNKSPGDRYASLAAVVDELEGFLYSAEAPARSGRGMWAGGLAVLLLAGAGAGVALRGPEAPTPNPTSSPSAAQGGAERAAVLYAKAQAKEGAARIELLRQAAGLEHAGALYELSAALAERSPVEAQKWLERAAEAGDLRGMVLWARFLADKEGRDDPAAARVWLERAIEGGEHSACVHLAELLSGGRGGPLDLAGARALVRHGAEAGDFMSMAAYGVMLQSGAGGPQDRDQAVEWLQRSAEGEDPAGLEALGNAYRRGWGVEVDFERAFALFGAAAAGGRVSALRSLGTAHLKGRGTEENPQEAFRCYLEAAKAGYLPAFCDVGSLYRLGVGTPVDYAAANRWQLRGAEGGDAIAMFALGAAAQRGDCGLPKDPEVVERWYRRSAEKGYPVAIYNLAVLLERRDIALAVEWYRKAAEVGYAPGISAMGELLAAGHGVPRDQVAARRYFERAARLGHVKAAYDLGLMWARGWGGATDASQAARWILRAAEAGHGPAMASYGKLLRDGWGVKQDLDLARKWLERGIAEKDSASMFALADLLLESASAPGGEVAEGERATILLRSAARAGHLPAMFQLGKELTRGRFVRRDLGRAYRWFREGAKRRDLDCLMALGDCLASGQGAARDLAAARKVYQQAARSGREDAKQALAELDQGAR